MDACKVYVPRSSAVVAVVVTVEVSVPFSADAALRDICKKAWVLVRTKESDEEASQLLNFRMKVVRTC